ncbi:hypothetical protein OESDEN_08479 [Oesophagostomum dentatum]|uniref:Uncharacterized protein n=1 Tax=Oesophagostomum dentatum TaxID=61180 RepID=A0A0B1T6C2_OESDE|nr:hypothetical protein OESDEN_08479 [Oesophagostomum dentatum]
MNERGYLRSWADELKYFESVPTFSVDDEHCDVIFERPTIVMKLDAAVNMYHHFCDFVNLYASQHINGSFSQQVDVVWWDTFSGGFVDAMFGDTWKAFTDTKPVELTALAGRRVCFKNVLFPLLARQRFGLYYNMPLRILGGRVLGIRTDACICAPSSLPSECQPNRAIAGKCAVDDSDEEHAV